MPNWKKVITSGSDAILNEVTASGGILTSQNIMPDADNTLSLGSSTQRFQLNGGTPVTVDGSGTSNTITRFQSATTVENSTITNSDTITTIVHDNDGNDIFIVSGSNGELIKVTDTIGETLFQVNDGSGISHFEVSSSGTLVAQNLEYTNETFVLTYNSQSGNINFFSASAIVGTPTLDEVTDEGATTTNTISVGGITVTSMGTGTDNSVVVKNSSNQLVTDEIDSRVWGSSLVDGANGANNRLATFSDANSLNGEANLTFDGSTLSVTGDANVSSNVFASTFTGSLLRLDENGTGMRMTNVGAFENSNGFHIFSNNALRFSTNGSSNESLKLLTNQNAHFSSDLVVSGSLVLDSVVNAGTDTDKFLVLDANGNVDFRTGTEVRSDIGAGVSNYGDSDVTAHINTLNVHSGSHLGTATTDDLSEGSTNVYYTDTRVKTKLNAEGVISGSEQIEDVVGGMLTGNTETNITVTYQDSDGTIDFDVDDATATQKGVIEIATNSEVTTGTDTSRAITPSSLTSITKLGTITTGNVDAILPSGVVSGSVTSPSQGTLSVNGKNIDLGLQVGDSPTFTNLTLSGDLTVEGSRTELQVTELNVEDKNITVASGAADSSAADGAGLTIDGANESLTWNHANSRFQFSDDLHVDGIMNIGSVSNAGTDTDKFLVLDSNNNVDFRTGAEVRSDIGALDGANGANNRIATFTDSNSLNGESKLLFDSSKFRVLSSNADTAGIEIYGGVNGVSSPYITPSGSFTVLQFGSSETGQSFDFRRNKIAFDSDVTNTYIQADSSSPENLEIHADQNIELRADGKTEVYSTLELNTVVNAGTDTDKFLVLDSNNNVDFRTGAEVYDDIGVTALSSSIASDIESLQSSVDSVVTPIQLVVDCKSLPDGAVAWYGITDLQSNVDRAFTTWIAPADGYLDEVVVSPEQSNTTTDDVALSFIKNAGNQGTVTVTMGAAGTNKTFSFGSSTYSFSKGDRLGLLFNKNTNTADLYNVMVSYRLDN